MVIEVALAVSVFVLVSAPRAGLKRAQVMARTASELPILIMRNLPARF
jgi:hypothetical protein